MPNQFTIGRKAKIVFDTAKNDSSGTSNKTTATHGTGWVLPKNAVVTNAYYVVNTTFTTANDSGTIALTTGQSAGDLKAAIAISDASNVWDAGAHGCLPGSYAERTVAGDTAILDAASKAASYIVLTANREVAVVVAVQALTAGKLTLYLEYDV